MKKTVLALTLAALAVPAFAQEKKAPEPELTISGNFGLFSDYRFRGISQTEKKPAAQGGFDLVHKNGFYLGTWASSVNAEFTGFTASSAGLELDVYGGYKFNVGSIGVDIGNLYYYYPGALSGSDSPNTNEVYLGLSYGPVTLKTSYATTKYFGGGANSGSYYVDLSTAIPLSDGLSLKAHVGYLSVKGGDTGTDYRVGIAKDIDGYVFGLDYVGNSGDWKDTMNGDSVSTPQKKVGGNRAVVYVTKTF